MSQILPDPEHFVFLKLNVLIHLQSFHFSYSGTIFRFPFRKSESVLSSNIYKGKTVQRLLESLQNEGHLCLLFMKNLEKIEFYHKTNRKSEPKLIYSAHADAPDKDKKFFANISNSKMSGDISYKLDINVTKEGSEEEFEYWISQYFSKGGEVGKLASKKNYIPLVGAAFPLCKDQTKSSGGQLFSFLPLPLTQSSPTGLNVHLNGYFALDQNRRHLKLNAAGQDAKSDPELLWNLLLIKELIPKCLANLIISYSNLARLNKEKVNQFALFIVSNISLGFLIR